MDNNLIFFRNLGGSSTFLAFSVSYVYLRNISTTLTNSDLGSVFLIYVFLLKFSTWFTQRQSPKALKVIAISGLLLILTFYIISLIIDWLS